MSAFRSHEWDRYKPPRVIAAVVVVVVGPLTEAAGKRVIRHSGISATSVESGPY